ncbi:MAG: C10 family peptidase [Prevotella sp.]|nr:C10 family peptidase [Prevotella sp.]
MKKVISLVMMLVSACALWAGPVDQQQALQTAQTYLSTHLTDSNAPQRRLRMAYQGADLQTANVEASNLYVFNINEHDGFIIVSGDDRTEAVLGYTQNGTFDPENIPANLRWWLDCYERQIEWVKANAPERSAVPAKSSAEVIAPLMTTKWDQGKPYNYETPVIDGKHAPTGCVATALAQVMNYYKWPQDETTTVPGYRRGGSDYINALPATTFDWDNMLDTYAANMDENDDHVKAVSKLMRYAGQVVHMSYGAESSGSNETYLIPGAMHDYFGYSNSGWEALRDNYSIAEWENLMLNELRNHRPVLYCGFTSSFEGHAFVCEGYDGEGKFYINWGWGGYADGPFRLSVLDASYSGIGGSATSNQFSWGQEAYIEIQPTGESTVEHFRDNLTAYSRPSVQNRVVTRNSSSENFKIRLFMPVINDTGGYYSKQQGYALYQGDEMVKRVYTSAISMGQGGATNNALTISFGSDLENGDYILYAVSQSKSTGNWEKNVGSDRNYLKVNIKDNTMTLTPVPFPDFTINDVTAKKNAVVVDFTNNGTEFNGRISVLNSEFKEVSWEQAAIAEGETTQVAFYIDDEKSDFSIYDVFYLNVDYWKENWFYTNATLEGSDLRKTLSILNLAEDGQTVYGSKVLCQVDLKNEGTGLYKHTITTEIINTANGNANTIGKEIVSVEPGESKRLSYEVPVTKAQRGNTYELTSIHNIDMVNKAEDKITFTPQAGAILWNGKGEVSVAPQEATFTVDDTAAAADVSAAYTSDAKANSNPNTIYMLDTSVPTGLKGKNVMNNKMTTANIHFYDGNEYFIPLDFSASKSTNYHRTISEANKWSTIALPFAPTKVTADGQEIDWQKSESDTGKSLYIMKFNGTDGDKVLFGYTDAMEAYNPYLIGIGPELAGKELVFTATGLSTLKATLKNPIVATVGNYQLTGVNSDTVIDGAFVIDGEKAKPANGAAIAPFRAYLSAEGGISYSEMTIVTGVELTGIHDIEMTTEGNGTVFNLAGQKVGTIKAMESLPKGIYVVNGKKVIVK